MAIDREAIDAEITLELDSDEISIAEFLRAVENFARLVREVTRESAPQRDSAGWNVVVYPGSAGVGLKARPGSFTRDDIDVIRENVIAGLRALDRGERPHAFNDRAIQAARSIGQVFSGRERMRVVRLWSGRDVALTIGQTIAERAAGMLEAAYEDDGSVDGFLEKLSAHGHFEFVVYDVLEHHPIKCEVDEANMGRALASFRKRVEVLGTVRYRRDGKPVSVKAREIVPFPDANDVPSLDEMRRLFSAGA
jgi:hypothetical protein